MSVEPSVIRANTNLFWVRKIDPVAVMGLVIASANASDGFTAKYELRSPESFHVIEATGSGNMYTANASAESTRSYAGGEYEWELYLIHDTGGRWFIDSGVLNVVAYTAGPQDLRSQVKKTLDAIEEMIAGKASKDVQEYSIQTGSGSRSLKNISITELIPLRDKYANLYQQELSRNKLMRGERTGKTIRVRFSR